MLGDLACGSAGAPYVARGLLTSLDLRAGLLSVPVPPPRLAALGDQLESVRKRMRGGREKSDDCKGVAGFTDDDWRRLEEIKPAEAAHANP